MRRRPSRGRPAPPRNVIILAHPAPTANPDPHPLHSHMTLPAYIRAHALHTLTYEEILRQAVEDGHTLSTTDDPPTTDCSVGYAAVLAYEDPDRVLVTRTVPAVVRALADLGVHDPGEITIKGDGTIGVRTGDGLRTVAQVAAALRQG